MSNDEAKKLLKEARKIITAHQSARLTHKDWLQRSADYLRRAERKPQPTDGAAVER